MNNLINNTKTNNKTFTVIVCHQAMRLCTEMDKEYTHIVPYKHKLRSVARIYNIELYVYGPTACIGREAVNKQTNKQAIITTHIHI